MNAHQPTSSARTMAGAAPIDVARQLTNLYLLAQIIDAGGFSAAARDMGTSRSLLSRRIIALEKALGTQLLHRDARHFAVTPAGEAVYRHAIAMCDAAHAAICAGSSTEALGHGTLRVSISDALMSLMSDVLTAFAEGDTTMQLVTRTHTNFQALLQRHADVVLHVGHGLPDSDEIVAHPLGHTRLVVVGSPALLERLGHPHHPDQVDAQVCLAYAGQDFPSPWSLRGTRLKEPPRRLVGDRITPMLKAACAGTGLVQLPLYACHEQIASGHLQTVFDAYEAQPLPMHALALASRASSEPIAGFIGFVREQLADMRAHGILPINA